MMIAAGVVVLALLVVGVLGFAEKVCHELAALHEQIDAPVGVEVMKR